MDGLVDVEGGQRGLPGDSDAVHKRKHYRRRDVLPNDEVDRLNKEAGCLLRVDAQSAQLQDSLPVLAS